MQARRRLLMQESGGLPNAYQAVEYLEMSNGTSAYIDTDIVPDETTIFTGEFSEQYYPNRRFGNYFGARSTIGTQANWFVSDGSGYGDAYFWYNNTYVVSDISRSKNKCKIQFASSGGFIEDLVTGDKDIMSYQCTSYPPYSIFIFARNQNGDMIGTVGPIRCYSATIEKQNSIVRNFIPCIRKSDNKPGMYDTVTKTFYTNAGTDEFIVPA